MADIIDAAQQHEAMFLAHALAAARAHEPDTPQERDGLGRVVCAECGEIIPPARLQALPGVGLCVECAEELIQITGGW